MAKNRHTFAKRQRELDKKRKADEKRAKRQGTPSDSDQDSELNPSEANPTDAYPTEATAAQITPTPREII